MEELNEMMETPLIQEAADGDPRHVEWLIEAGADVNAKMKDKDSKIGFTALHGAAYFGNSRCLEVLLQHNAKVEELDAKGGTPLVAACLFGELECIRILLEKGADFKYPAKPEPVPYIDKATDSGTTPLMKAAIGGYGK
jgi:ankyrin repeat protein